MSPIQESTTISARKNYVEVNFLREHFIRVRKRKPNVMLFLTIISSCYHIPAAIPFHHLLRIYHLYLGVLEKAADF